MMSDNFPRKQAIVGPTLGNGWSCWQHVIDGVLTLTQHWTNTKVSTVEVLLLAQRRNFIYTHQRWILSCGANVGPKTCLPTIFSRVIFLIIKFILIMQKLYNLLLCENSVILFCCNNVMIYILDY